MRSTAPLLVLGAVALASAVGLAPACASRGHTGGDDDTIDSDGGLDATTLADGRVILPLPPEGGCDVAAPPAPPVLGVSVFSDSCKTGATPTVDFSPMRRISRIEYNNAVQDLLGNTTQPATGFNPESDIGAGVNLLSNTYLSVAGGDLIEEQYLQAAEAVGKAAVLSTPAGDGGPAVDNLATVYALNGIVPYPCATENDACAQQFIAAFANRAFRGQFDSNEATILFNVYSNIADTQNFGFRIGIQAVITAVLSSPYFLYVVEFGDGTAQTGSATPLSQYEIAARLAFYLWRSVPDIGPGSLMEAAAAGTLSTPAQIQAQAQRMLTVQQSVVQNGTLTTNGVLKAAVGLTDFATQLLELQAAPSGKDTVFTNWSKYPAIGQEMKDETITNVLQLVLAENGGLTELLTSSSSYVNSDLAGFYGASVGSGTAVTVADPLLSSAQQQFVQTPLPNRAGVLTNGSILAINSHSLLPSYVLRGKMVREDLLCDPIGPPPKGVTPLPATVPDGGTTRQLFAVHSTGTCYSTCHEYMDDIGYASGHYDATGAYQALDENGASTGPALDVTGEINAKFNGELMAAISDVPGTTGLASTLASAPQVQECFALQEFRYSLGRLETADDACSIQQFYSAFTGGSLNIQKLILAIVASDAFRYRSAIGDACQFDAGSCP